MKNLNKECTDREILRGDIAKKKNGESKGANLSLLEFERNDVSVARP